MHGPVLLNRQAPALRDVIAQGIDKGLHLLARHGAVLSCGGRDSQQGSHTNIRDIKYWYRKTMVYDERHARSSGDP